MTPLQLAVFGYGHFLRTNVLKRLRDCDAVHIVGLYTYEQELCQQAIADGWPATTDMQQLLARPDVQAVYVGTANHVHREHALAAIRAGKHVLCEKPMAMNRTDAHDMAQAAEQAGVITHVNFGRPYTDGFLKVHELAAAHCGRIMQVWVRNSRQFGTWEMGARHAAVAYPEVSGGWTVHHACHALNAACVLLNSATNPATRVYHVKQASCDDAPSEELVTSIIRFTNGAVAQLCDGTTIGGFGDLGVIGTDADVRLCGNTVMLATCGAPDPDQRPGNLGHVIQTFEINTDDKNIQRVFRLFADAVRTGDGGRLLGFRRICHEFDILAAMAESARTGEAAAVAWK